MIPYGKQSIDRNDVKSVMDVLKSDFLTQGSQVPKFEKVVSNYCGSRFGVATNSATSALHIACLALGLRKGDRFWTSPNTFVASANCGLYCGASVDFVDIDPLTYNICTEKLEKKLKKAKKDGKLPKVVIPVHFAGQSCEMKKIHSLSKEYKFKIIEDASHAIGGRYLKNLIGCCKYSDITVFSFHPVKIITTAEGGLATTNDKGLFARMQLLRTHGITRDAKLISKKKLISKWFYQQIELGYNYRMNDLQAALGISQMKKIDKFISKRREIQYRYDKALKKLPLIIPHQSPNSFSSLHLYTVQIKPDELKKNRKEIFEELQKNKIGVNVHYIPVHTHPFFKKLGFKKNLYPNAETYYKNAISLPIFPGLTIKMQNEVINTLEKTLI